jgi:hypothetical protein
LLLAISTCFSNPQQSGTSSVLPFLTVYATWLPQKSGLALDGVFMCTLLPIAMMSQVVVDMLLLQTLNMPSLIYLTFQVADLAVEVLDQAAESLEA